MLPDVAVNDGLTRHRDIDHVAACDLDRLLNGAGDLFGLAVADTDFALAVADSDEGRERETATTLDDLGYPVDGDHALVELRIPASISAASVHDALLLPDCGGSRGTARTSILLLALHQPAP